jgi:hypothetical protein
MKKILFSILIFVIVGAFSQNVNDENSSDIFGVFTLDQLMISPYDIWFNENYSYDANEEIIKKLKNFNTDFEVLIILGTWCSDSQEQVPRFLKILDEIGLDKSYLLMVAVDREKKVDNFNIEKYKIERVPTIIIKRNNEEIGRIIETPIKTLEEDLLQILTN